MLAFFYLMYMDIFALKTPETIIAPYKEITKENFTKFEFNRL